MLTSNLGGTGDNFTDTTFADSATTSISAGAPPFTGSFRPLSPLSALNGKNIAGTWQLLVLDPFFSATEPRVINDVSITVRNGTTGQDTFTVQLPTGTPGDFGEAVSFTTNDADEGSFSISLTGFVGEVPTFASFTVAGGAVAQSANPVPFAFTESGSFPATSIEVSEDSDFTTFQSYPVPGGTYDYTFASGISGARTLYARLLNAAGASASQSVNTILDNLSPNATITPVYENRVVTATFTYNPYTTTDSHSGVKEVDVWLKPPGGTWNYAFTQNPPTGNFNFTATDGPGIYLLDIVARDFAGNTSAPPTSINGKRVIAFNPVENGPFPFHFPSPLATTIYFPMEATRQASITFAPAPTTGVLTVQRFETNANAAGLDPDSLINESWTITGSGGFSFTSANIAFGYDTALLNGLDETTELINAYRVEGLTVTTFPGTVDSFSHRFTVTGVTGFSDWFIGEPMPTTSVGDEWIMY